jgi:hypothetical protein
MSHLEIITPIGFCGGGGATGDDGTDVAAGDAVGDGDVDGDDDTLL